MVSLLVDKQQTVTDEDKEKKVKKEKGGKEAGGVVTKSHGLEGYNSLFYVRDENVEDIVLNIEPCVEK